MEICIYRAYEEMSRAAAQEVADVLNAKPNAVLGMATGSTPLGVYQHLVKMHERGEIEGALAAGAMAPGAIADAGRSLNHIAAETAMLEERWLEASGEIEAIEAGAREA